MSGELARSRLSAAINAGMQSALRSERAYVAIRAGQAVRDGAAVGFVELDGDGESVAEISFPLKFIEKPIFTAGLELGENAWLRYGTFPSWSATVGAWLTEPAPGQPIHTGAIIGIYVAGAPKAILHYRFEARSFVSPVGASVSLAPPL